MLRLRRVFSSSSSTFSFPAVDKTVGGAPILAQRQAAPRQTSRSLLLGTVCYSESVASIWKGMMRHFARSGVEVETVLYSSYERMNQHLLTGAIQIAWNGPLSHARVIRLVGQENVLSLGMRDSDRDFQSLCVVREDSGIEGPGQLPGRRVGLGTVDSPQAYIAPLAHLVASAGVPLDTLTVYRYDRDIGKHGDTAHGETGVLEALRSGAVEAGFLSDMMWQRFVAQGLTGGLRVVPALCPPPFDHCQFTALQSSSPKSGKPGQISRKKAVAFQNAVLAMDGSGHSEDAHTLKLEGVKKAWLPARGGALTETTAPNPTVGYEAMLGALDTLGDKNVRFPGHLHTPKRHPFKHLLVDSSLVRDSFGC